MIRNLQLVSLGRVLVAAAASERIRGMISSRVAIPPQYYAVLRTTLTYQLSVPCRPAGLRADDIFTSRNIRSWWIARRREGHYNVGWLLLVVYFTSTNTVWPLQRQRRYCNYHDCHVRQCIGSSKMQRNALVFHSHPGVANEEADRKDNRIPAERLQLGWYIRMFI